MGSLPNLNSTRDNFLKLNSNKLIEDFKDFFITNNIDRIFELVMLYRYFDILLRQIIGNYNSISTA
jgi:hypothetical protein